MWILELNLTIKTKKNCSSVKCKSKLDLTVGDCYKCGYFEPPAKNTSLKKAAKVHVEMDKI